MTNAPPNYKILHIQPCEYYTPTPPQTSSEDNADMSILQFQIFHFLKRCIPVENGRFYDYDDHPRLTKISYPVKEIETSVLLQGNSDERAARDLSLTLSSLEIPENNHVDIIERISEAARQEQTTTANNTKSVNLDVKIGGITMECVYYDQEVADEIARMENEAMQDNEMVESVPASRSCIEALEKMRIGGMEEVKQQCRCSICLKEFRVGLEVTRLPCSHVYHPDCIVKWLETSHMCPLCRHPMPLDTSTN